MLYLFKSVLKTLRVLILFPVILLPSLCHYIIHIRLVKFKFFRLLKLDIISFVKFLRLSNLSNPKSFKDFIQAYMFIEIPNVVDRMDKLRVKTFVRNKLDDTYVIPNLRVYEDFRSIDFSLCGVVKINNDSGGIYLNTNSRRNLSRELDLFIRKYLVYGFWVGEWAYGKIKPKYFTEEFVSNLDDLADYKFYVVKGKVIGCHYIYNRHVDAPTSELWLDREQSVHEYSIHKKFNVGCSVDYKRVEDWEEMVAVAEELSEDVLFVRVDLYKQGSQILFGELTYWPQAGLYKGKDVNKVWNMIEKNL